MGEGLSTGTFLSALSWGSSYQRGNAIFLNFAFLNFPVFKKGRMVVLNSTGSGTQSVAKKWTSYCLILWPLESGKIRLLNQLTDCLLVPSIKHGFPPIHPRVALIFFFNRLGYSSRTSVLKRFQGSRREVGGICLGSGSAVRCVCVCVCWVVCMWPNFQLQKAAFFSTQQEHALPSVWWVLPLVPLLSSSYICCSVYIFVEVTPEALHLEKRWYSSPAPQSPCPHHERLYIYALEISYMSGFHSWLSL